MSAPRDRRSPIRQARADALWELLGAPRWRNGLRLDGDAYRSLAAMGLSRTLLSSAADLLVRDGRATVSVEAGVVVLRRARQDRDA